MLSVTSTERGGTAEAVAVAVRSDRPEPADPPLGTERVAADIAAFLRDVEASGEAGRVDVLPLPGARPKLVYAVGVGLGEPPDLRRAGAALVRAALAQRGQGRRLVSWLGCDAEPDAVRALVEATMLASYTFTRASNGQARTLREIALVQAEPAAPAAALSTPVTGALDLARAGADATAFARDLANTPSLEKSPAWLARQADRALHAAGMPPVRFRVLDGELLERGGFGGILAVGGGSARPPRLIEASYGPRTGARHIVLVGKGITFDSGGLSLKPNQGMKTMKTDMAGGAAVLGALVAAARLRLPVRVTAVVPAAENMPSGSAYRPGDVIRHYGGRTTEVRNTDAEGRLVLADALAYSVARLRPDAIIDVATLTGAARVALGARTGGLFATDDDLAAGLLAAGAGTGEALWRLPLSEDYLHLLDSPVADANNAPGNPGAITAALFLRPFAADVPWAHLDIAGPARAGSDDGEVTSGGTGFGVRTLLRFLEAQV